MIKASAVLPWRKPAGIVIVGLGVLILCISALWVRSYWVGDELDVSGFHRHYRLYSTGGAVFWLDVHGFPKHGRLQVVLDRGEPSHAWNFAKVWGPTSCWWQFPRDPPNEPLVEYAEGSWMNFLTGDQPTPMRYRAFRAPHWMLLAPLVLFWLFVELRHRRAAGPKVTARTSPT